MVFALHFPKGKGRHEITKTLRGVRGAHYYSHRAHLGNNQLKNHMFATTNAVAKVAAVVAGLGLVAMSFASFAPAAKAMTADEIAAQIAALQAQLAALGGSTSAGTTFTVDLTIGSTGADVTALQNWLISKGYSIPAGATGYFGSQTQAALAAYQAANGISPAAGYFGPITRAKVNASGGSTGSTGGSTGSTGGLSGGAGSVDSYTLMSSLNNEEVGEGEEDVEVLGVEVEASEGSDLEFTAVKVKFTQGSAGSKFVKYADEVSVWLDGEEVGRVDASKFTSDNSYTYTINLDSGAIVRAEDTGDLVVAVSGISNLDSGDANDTWTADITQVRFKDADGATISEDPLTAARTFSFQNFATATNAELKIQDDDDAVNDARTIEVDDTADTDNVPVLSFTLQNKGDSDLDIKDWAVSVTVATAAGSVNTDDILKDLTLWIDGEEVASADTVSSGGLVEDYHFDDVDYTVGAGDTVSAELRADFNDITTGTFDEGDTIAFAILEDITDQTTLVSVEDENGDELVDADITGSTSSGTFELRSTGINVTFVSASEVLAANDTAGNYDSGTFKIVYNVEAFGNTVYVSDNAAATIATSIPETTFGGTDGVIFFVQGGSGGVTTADLSSAVTYSTSGGASAGSANIQLQDGEDADFTLTVTRTNNNDSTDDDLYRVLLKGIGWSTSDSASSMTVYDFNLEDFKTDYISLN